MEDGEEKKKAIELLGRKYYPADTAENLARVIEKENEHFVVIALDIEQLTGKEAIELVRTREK